MSNTWAELFPAGQFLVIFSLWCETSPGMVCSAAYQFLLLKFTLQFIIDGPVLNVLPIAPCHSALGSHFPYSVILCLSVLKLDNSSHESFLPPRLVFT